MTRTGGRQQTTAQERAQSSKVRTAIDDPEGRGVNIEVYFHPQDQEWGSRKGTAHSPAGVPPSQQKTEGLGSLGARKCWPAWGRGVAETERIRVGGGAIVWTP